MNCLKKNLETIHEINESLFDWITEKEEPAEWYEIIKNNMLYIEGRKRIALYDMDDPVKGTAEKLKDFNFYKQDVSVAIGCGLGFVLGHVLEECEKGHKIILIEHDRNLLSNFLSKTDVSKHLNDRTLLIIQPERDWIIDVMGSLDGLFTVEGWHLLVETYAKKRIKYLETINIVIELINQFKCNTGTVVSAGGQIADNDILTLPYLIKHRGINELKDLYKGKPAVLVSTGPSLSKNIHLLQKSQDKVVIIAVGQALRILLAYDIRPDFICTVDFGEVNMGHFKGLMDSDVPLIALNRTYAPLLQQYQGPIFVVGTPNSENDGKAVNIMADKGFLQQGGSVAHLCLSAGKHLGCDPLIIIGQDLSVGTESHCKQADASGKISVNSQTGLIDWKVKDPRCHLNEQTYSMGPVSYVPGYFGAPVMTNIGLASFITSFENIIRPWEGKPVVYNATEGGADIPEMIKHTLRLCLENYASKSIDKDVLKPFLSLADNGDELIEKVVPLLEEDIGNMKNIIKWSIKGIAKANEVSRLLNKNKSQRTKKWSDKFKKVLKENEDTTITAHKYSAKVPLVNIAIFGAVRAIKTREMMQGISGTMQEFKKSDKNVRIRIKRNKHILKAARKAAELLKKSTEKSYKILKSYSKLKDINILKPRIQDDDLSLNDAQEFLDNGNFARPLLIARKLIEKNTRTDKHGLSYAEKIITDSIKMRDDLIGKAEESMNETDSEKEITYNRLIETAQKMGREEKRYKPAKKLLEEAVELFPDREIGLYGLASVYAYTGDFEKSVESYEKLVKQYPDNHLYLFELGRIMTNIHERVFDGIKIVAEAMTKTEEYDGFFVTIGDLYKEYKMYKESLLAYDTYLEKFPADYKVWIKKNRVHKELGQDQEADEAKMKAEALI